MDHKPKHKKSWLRDGELSQALTKPGMAQKRGFCV